MNSEDHDSSDDLMRGRIVEAAVGQLRRYGDAKTNVVDIAQALGTSHTTLYRHFRSKADIFAAVVREAMRDEEELARAYADADRPAAERLEAMVLALHARKRDRLADDPEVYALYRRMMVERPEIIADYSAAMTALVARILADGVRRGEFAIDDIAAAAGVVRDAVTVFVHPMHVEAAARAGLPVERLATAVMRTLVSAFVRGRDGARVRLTG